MDILNQPEKCLLIRGVPGGGKSQQLIEIIEMAISTGYSPDDIFVGSFSRVDSEKFAERLEERLGYASVPVHTIHSLCYRIVWAYVLKQKARKYLSQMGTLNIASSKEQTNALDFAQARHIRESQNSPPLVEEVDYQRYIDYSKSVGRRPSSSLAKDDDRMSVYYHYQHVLAQQGTLDFGDLLLRAESVLKEDDEILDTYCYKLMLLDEAMDLSEQQMKVIELIVTKADKVVFSYDTAQSIYSFRGAVGHNIEKRIRKIFPADETATIDLLDNHRSLPAIVSHAEGIFRRGMKSVRKLNGGKYPEGLVVVHPELIVSEKQYAKEVLGMVQEYKDDGYDYGDIHILCRTRADMAPVNQILVENSIPTITGGMPFTQRSECKDLIAWMKLANPRSLWETPSKSHPFMRVYNKPPIKLVDADGFEIKNKDDEPMYLSGHWLKQFKRQGGTIEDRLRPTLYNEKYSRAILHLLQSINYLQSLEKPVDVLSYVINIMKPSYRQYFASLAISSKLDYLQLMIDLAGNYDNVSDYLDMLDTVDKLVKVNAVEISTIHSAKGVDGMKAVIHIDNPYVDKDKNEADRIRYVACTRAGERLNIVHYARPRV